MLLSMNRALMPAKLKNLTNRIKSTMKQKVLWNNVNLCDQIH